MRQNLDMDENSGPARSTLSEVGMHNPKLYGFCFERGMCPLLDDFLCPKGEEIARECQDCVRAGFDPIARFGDLCILECARKHARQRSNSLIKFWY